MQLMDNVFIFQNVMKILIGMAKNAAVIQDIKGILKQVNVKK